MQDESFVFCTKVMLMTTINDKCKTKKLKFKKSKSRVIYWSRFKSIDKQK